MPKYHLFALALLTSASPSFAQSSARLQLQLNRCVSVDFQETGRLLAIELNATLVSTAHEDALRVSVDCQNRFMQVRVDDPATQVPVVENVESRPLIEIRVEDPYTGKALRRTIDLRRDTRASHGRLLAIAIAELVRASWLELEANPTPQIPPVGKLVRPPREVVENMTRTLHNSAIHVAGGALLFGEPNSPFLWGGEATFAHTFSHPFALSLGVEVLHGKKKHVVGPVQIDTISAKPTLVLGQTLGDFHLHLGFGARLGWLHFAGSPKKALPVTSSASRAFWSTVDVELGASYFVTSQFNIVLSLDVFFVTKAVTADVALGEKISMRGLGVRPSLAFGWIL